MFVCARWTQCSFVDEDDDKQDNDIDVYDADDDDDDVEGSRWQQRLNS